MKVTLPDGRELSVYWKKFHTKRNTIDTQCFAMCGLANLSKTARQNPMDRYSKVTGKKLSLSRALRVLTKPVILLDGRHEGLTKSDRKIIWEEFKRTFKIGV